MTASDGGIASGVVGVCTGKGDVQNTNIGDNVNIHADAAIASGLIGSCEDAEKYTITGPKIGKNMAWIRCSC